MMVEPWDEPMDHRPSGSRASEPGASGLEILAALEKRVRGLVQDLREARKARRRAEAEAEDLRRQIQDRDDRITLLSGRQDCEELRRTLRARVEALLRSVDELERGG